MGVECSLRFVWEAARDATIQTLANTTFADLAGRPEVRGAIRV
jgi:DNA-binding IscR family transcriptional regulator